MLAYACILIAATAQRLKLLSDCKSACARVRHVDPIWLLNGVGGSRPRFAPRLRCRLKVEGHVSRSERASGAGQEGIRHWQKWTVPSMRTEAKSNI